MTQKEHGILDKITGILESLAQEMGLADLVDTLKVKDDAGKNNDKTVSPGEYEKLSLAYGRLEQEIEGYKARLRREHDQSVRHAESKALESSFRALDALEGALQSLDVINLNPEIKEQIAQGILLQRDVTLAYLARTYGVNPVSSIGTQADPQYHHVVSEIPSEYSKGTIVAVIQVGYTRDGELIREAVVAVAGGE